MKLEKIIRLRKRIRNLFIIFAWLLCLTIIVLFGVLIFVNKYKWNMTNNYILIAILVEALMVVLSLLLINKTHFIVNNICNLLAKPLAFDLNAKDSSKINKESGYKSVDALLYSNEIHYENESFKSIRSDITIIRSETELEHAKLYLFETKYNFSEHYLLSHSLNISGFDKYHKEALGNTNIYLTDLLDISNMNVEFSSNFYIAFTGNKIYFIDFNRKILNLEKDKIDDNKFIEYINESKEDIIDFYNKLIVLK